MCLDNMKNYGCGKMKEDGYWSYVRNNIKISKDGLKHTMTVILMFVFLTIAFIFLIKFFGLIGVVVSLIIGVIASFFISEYIFYVCVIK